MEIIKLLNLLIIKLIQHARYRTYMRFSRQKKNRHNIDYTNFSRSVRPKTHIYCRWEIMAWGCLSVFSLQKNPQHKHKNVLLNDLELDWKFI
jgi:hypothetical protein